MSWSVLQVGGGRRDPWWDPDAHARRRRSRRRLERAAVAFVLAAVAIGAGTHPARAGTSLNLDQWASPDLAWQNGDLNGNNSRYPEGGIVPFRVALEGLAPGAHRLHMNYDFTAGGHKAYDFLAT